MITWNVNVSEIEHYKNIMEERLSKIYMILVTDFSEIRHVNNYDAYYTSDPIEAAKALEIGHIVYKLDNLTELKEIEINYQEIPMEMTNE